MAPVQDVQDALQRLGALVRSEWDKNVGVKACKAEAAARALEKLLRDADIIEEGVRVVKGDIHMVERDVRHNRKEAKRKRVRKQECDGGHERRESLHLPFAHIGGWHLSGREKHSSLAEKHSLFVEEQSSSGEEHSSSVEHSSSLGKGLSRGHKQRPPFAALSWLPGFLGGEEAGLRKQEAEGEEEEEWIEEVGNERREYSRKVNDDGTFELAMKVLVDERPLRQKLADKFRDTFFPVGYPESVAEGYQVYSQWRAVQHFTSAILGVLSGQSVLFAAGLRPTPAQATVVSWVLKEGMQHVGKLAGSSMGPRMDADPKKWRIIADVTYDVGAALEIVSPLMPSYFLPVAGAANLAKGIALLAARSTRLPIYTAFAKHGNVGDLYAKGEALSVLSNVAGMWLGIQLASGVCSSAQGKMLAFPFLSGLHVFCVAQEMRAAPMNFLNAQRTALLVEDYVKHGVVRSPPELRYREKLIFPPGINVAAGSVRIGAPLRTAVRSPKDLAKLRRAFRNERFLLNVRDGRSDLILHRDATGEDVLKGWLLAAHVANGAAKSESTEDPVALVKEGYKKLDADLPSFLEEIKKQGWQTKQFHEGAGKRAVW